VAVVAEAVLRARVLCWAVLPHVKEEDGRTGLWISGRPEEGRTLRRKLWRRRLLKDETRGRRDAGTRSLVERRC